MPAVAYWLGKIKAGSVYNDLALQLDIFPTILSITGIGTQNLQNRLDGEDISPVLFGNGHRKGDEFAYFNNGKIEAFRKGGWKFQERKLAASSFRRFQSINPYLPSNG